MTCVPPVPCPARRAACVAWRAQEVDLDGNGTLDETEVANLCQLLGMALTREERSALVDSMDDDGAPRPPPHHTTTAVRLRGAPELALCCVSSRRSGSITRGEEG